MVEGALYADVSVTRGCAALALARLDGDAALGRIEQFHAQAVDRFERLFATLAILHLAPDRYARVAAQLRGDLAHDSFFYEVPLQRDIIDVLSAVEPARELVTVWSQLYRGGITWHA